jgi:hypothetical protein
MARAVLEIDANTSGIAAAFGAIRTQAQETERAVRGSLGNLFAGIPQGSRRAQQAASRDAQTMSRDQERAAQSSVRAFVRGEEQKRRAAQLTAEGRARAERQATEIARSESQRRGLTAEQEARLRQTALERVTRSVEGEERRQTQAVERESRRRERAGRDIGIGLRRGLNVGGDAALNVARQAHSQIQDARRQRAESEHTLNAAFYQAGIGGGEATAMRARLEREISTGGLRGLSMDQVSGALMGAQTQFSALSGANPAERAARFNRQIELARFARATFQDPGEVMRVAGMLSQQGVGSADQMATLRSLTGMAQAGSIELSTLTSTALGPLMANVSRSVSATMAPAERASAVQRAVSETMAVGELGAAAGLSPRDSLNALAKMRSSVENPMVADRLDARLRATGREDLAGQLVTRDAQGRAQLRDRNPIALMSSLVSGMGGDANAVSNLLSAGGRNAAMVLDSQQRRLILGMASQTGSGQTVAQRVAQMEAAGTRFGVGDIARGAAMVEGEQRTALQASEETRLGALTDNTSAMVQLSNAINGWTVRNPIAAAGVQSGGGLLGGALGGALFPRIGQALAGTTLGGWLTGGGVGASLIAAKASALAALGSAGGIGATLAGSVGAAGVGTAGAAALASAGAGLGVGALVNRALYSDVTGATEGGVATGTARGQASYTNPLSADFWRGFGTSLSQAVRDGMSNATVTATVSPVDATHAATQGAP